MLPWQMLSLSMGFLASKMGTLELLEGVAVKAKKQDGEVHAGLGKPWHLAACRGEKPGGLGPAVGNLGGFISFKG